MIQTVEHPSTVIQNISVLGTPLIQSNQWTGCNCCTTLIIDVYLAVCQCLSMYTWLFLCFLVKSLQTLLCISKPCFLCALLHRFMVSGFTGPIIICFPYFTIMDNSSLLLSSEFIFFCTCVPPPTACYIYKCPNCLLQT